MKNFYIADIHFGHANIIRYDRRPFGSVEEMDEALISNWNSVVSCDDSVYVLGDISWHNTGRTVEILDRLTGIKHLIRGNHDKLSGTVASRFESVGDYLTLDDSGTQVVMSHYPMPFWDGQLEDSVHLYGHIHNTPQWNILLRWQEELRREQNIPVRMYNVGCMMDYMDYTPRTLDEIIEKCRL